MHFPGNPKGVHVATMDPYTGPFSTVERNLLRRSLEQGFSKDIVSLEDYLICIIFFFFGPRPIQVAAMKVSDVRRIEKEDESISYYISIPSAKKRLEIRKQSREWKIAESNIGFLLWEHAQNVKKKFIGMVQDVENVPLFPQTDRTAQMQRLQYHREANSIGACPKAVWKKLDVFSERTGEIIHISPSRFRDTLGTTAASEGWGEYIIAELLDHADIQNVTNYVGNTPDIVKKLSKKAAKKMAPLARAFQGEVASKEELQAQKGRQAIIAPQYTNDFLAVGICGQHTQCSFAVPLGCYQCPMFTAWLDGPHEEILDRLIAESNKVAELDETLGKVHQTTILAIAEVVELCAKEMEKRA